MAAMQERALLLAAQVRQPLDFGSQRATINEVRDSAHREIVGGVYLHHFELFRNWTMIWFIFVSVSVSC
jgi:hypothetical protein